MQQLMGFVAVSFKPYLKNCQQSVNNRNGPGFTSVILREQNAVLMRIDFRLFCSQVPLFSKVLGDFESGTIIHSVTPPSGLLYHLVWDQLAPLFSSC